MDEAARDAFLARFREGGQGIGFAVLGAVGYARALSWNPLEGPMNTLAVYAYFMFTKPLSPAVRDPSLERAWAAALLLVLLVVALNLTARLIAKIFAPKTGR